MILSALKQGVFLGLLCAAMVTHDLSVLAKPAVFPDGATTNAFYDAIGRLIAATDERGNPTWFGFDRNCGCSGRQTSITNALGQVTHFHYDQNGNQIEMTDALQRATVYGYDAMDRRTHVVFPDGTQQITTFDPLGRRIAETDQAELASRKIRPGDTISGLKAIRNLKSFKSKLTSPKGCKMWEAFCE